MKEMSHVRICEVSLMGAAIDLALAIENKDKPMQKEVMSSIELLLRTDPEFMPRLMGLQSVAQKQMERDLREKGKYPIV